MGRNFNAAGPRSSSCLLREHPPGRIVDGNLWRAGNLHPCRQGARLPVQVLRHRPAPERAGGAGIGAGAGAAGVPAMAGAARLLRVHHQRIPLWALPRPASQGTGVRPGLDVARTAGLHQQAFRSAGPIVAARPGGERQHPAGIVQGIHHDGPATAGHPRQPFTVRQAY